MDYQWRSGGRRDCVCEHGSARGEKGITALVAEKGARVSRSAKKKKNWGSAPRRAANSFSRIAKCLLQTVSGMKARATKSHFRLWMAGASALRAGHGHRTGRFRSGLKYSQERMAFGHPISNFQAIQFMLADMSTEIDARGC